MLLPYPHEPCLGFPLAQLICPWVRAGGAQTDLLASSFLSFPSELLAVPALKGFPLGPLLLMLLLEWERVALWVEQASMQVTASSLWKAQVSWGCLSSGQWTVQG